MQQSIRYKDQKVNLVGAKAAPERPSQLVAAVHTHSHILIVRSGQGAKVKLLVGAY